MKKLYILFLALTQISLAMAQSRVKSTATGGNWSSGSTWVGGLVPLSTDTLEVVSGSTVTLNNSTTSVAKAEIKGTLDFASTGTAFIVNGNLTVFLGGILNAFNISTGKSVVVNGNFINNGIIEFSRAGCILTLGQAPSATSISGSGTFNIIRQLSINNSNGVTLSSAIRVSNNLSLLNGIFNNGNNLTIDNTVIGSGPSAPQCIIQRSQASSLSTTYTLGATASLFVTYAHNGGVSAAAIIEGYEIPTSRSLFRITASNSSGIYINDNLTLKSGSGGVILSSGIIHLAPGKTLTCTSALTSLGAGTSTSYVAGGAIAQTVSTTATTLTFPIGDTQNRSVIVSGIKASAGTMVFKFNLIAPSGGTVGIGFNTLSGGRRWLGTAVSGTISQYTGIGLAYHSDDSLGIGAQSEGRIVTSAALNGTYTSLGGGINTSTHINAATNIYTSTGYFALGRYIEPPTTYYLSATGSDAANGKTQGTAWQTLAKVNATVFRAGDTLLLKSGDTFYGKLRVSTANFLIDAYGSGAKPIINGAEKISSAWTVNNGSIWETTFSANKPAEIRALKQNALPLPISRYPNKSTNNGYLNFESHNGLTQFTDNELTGSPDWTGSTVNVRVERYRLVKSSVISQSGGTITIPTSSEVIALIDGYGYFFSNDLKAIDSEGEWAYTSGDGKVYLYSAANPNSQLIYFPRQDTVVLIKNVDFVKFRNIEVKDAGKYGIYVQNSKGTLIDGALIKSSGGDGAFFNSSSGCTFQNSSISDVNWSGLVAPSNCNTITIQNSTFSNIGNEAFGKSKTFIGIDCNASNSIIQNNTVARTGYAGIITAGLNNLVKRNLLDSVCLHVEDNGGIYTNFNINNNSGTIIEENFVTNSIGELLGAPSDFSKANGIYLDNNSKDVTVRNNTVSFVNGAAYFINSSQSGNKLFTNTSFASGVNEFFISGPASAPTYEIDSNIFVANTTSAAFNVIQIKASAFTYPQLGTFKGNYVVNPFNERTILANFKDGVTKTIRQTPYEWEGLVPQVSGTVPRYIKYGGLSNPSTVIKFYKNPSTSSATVTLPAGLYVDAKNQAYCGTASVPAYRSLILFRIDTVNCISPAGCSAPTGYMTDSITNNSAKLRWYRVPDARNYDVRYRQGSSGDWNYLHNVQDTVATVIGLNAETAYQYQLRTSCYGTESNWTSTDSLKTLAAVFGYNFVNATLANCSPGSAFATPNSATDNKWTVIVSNTGSADGNYIQSMADENSPQLTMDVPAALDSIGIYDIYFYYLSPSTQAWDIHAKLLSNTSMILFNRATAGAELLADVTGSNSSNRLFRAKLGTVSGVTGFSVLIDDIQTNPVLRSVFDGVAFKKVGELSPVPAEGLRFDGTDDHVSLPSAQLANLQNFTFETWVNWNGVNDGAIYAEGSTESLNQMFSIIPRKANSGGLEIVLKNATGTGLIAPSTVGKISANAWTHLAFVRNSATSAELFINGIKTDAFTFTDPGTFSVNTANIGVRQGSTLDNPYGGKIDEVRLWSRALCQGEIQNNMNAQLAGSQSGLLAYYKFNQGIANALNTGVNTLADSSGNNRTGNLINFGLNSTNSNWTDGKAKGTAPSFMPPTAVVVADGPTTFCPSGNVLLKAQGGAGYTYQWTKNGAALAGETTANYSATTSGSYGIMVVSNGCVALALPVAVTVQDSIAPTITSVQPDVIVALDLNGNASVANYTASLTASDNCTTTSSIVISQSPAAGSSLVPNVATVITLTARDASGNSRAQTFTVTATDQTPPVKPVLANITGECFVTVPVPVTTDNFSGTTTGTTTDALSYSVQGTYVVNWTFTDGAGNSSTAMQTVIVKDVTAPIALAKNITIQLNASGSARIEASDINNGSTDNCEIAGISIDKSLFSCSNIGPNEITLTVRDKNGFVSTATAIVTVEDRIAPVAITKNVVVQLNASGNGSTTALAVNNGSSDACGIASIVLSKTDFNCSNVGSNTVTLTVTDQTGNISTATATVTVEDKVAPVAIAKNITISLVNGSASITAASINNGSNDACGIKSLQVIGTTSYGCTNFGNHTVRLSVTDNSGNVSTATSIVTVLGETTSTSIASLPTNNTYTGGNNNNLYLGYGAQSTTLKVTPINVSSNGPTQSYTYVWSGNGLGMLSSTTSGSPIFSPTASGTYTFYVTAKNFYGCTSTSSITICVRDIRVPGTNGKRVYLCHVPQGDINGATTISVAVNKVDFHLSNDIGDKLGECNQLCGSTAGNVTSSELQESEHKLKGSKSNLIAYPNPFGAETTVTFTLTKDEAKVSLGLFGLNGSKVQDLYNGPVSAYKTQTFSFSSGNLPSGMYFFRLKGANANLTYKVIIVR